MHTWTYNRYMYNNVLCIKWISIHMYTNSCYPTNHQALYQYTSKPPRYKSLHPYTRIYTEVKRNLPHLQEIYVMPHLFSHFSPKSLSRLATSSNQDVLACSSSSPSRHASPSNFNTSGSVPVRWWCIRPVPGKFRHGYWNLWYIFCFLQYFHYDAHAKFEFFLNWLLCNLWVTSI